jgi:DNA-binding CsgD family transcriptional regulator
VSDIDTIEDIYGAVGDPARWQHLTERLASARPLSTEVEWHLAIGRKAHEQQLQLKREISALMTVHDRLTLGALVVDEDGRILDANAIASQHLADQAALTRDGERVQAVALEDNLVLSDAIREASSAANSNALRNPFLVLTRPRRTPLSVVVVRDRHRADDVFEKSRPVALLLIDPDLTAPPDTEFLRALFGFTAREAKLAAILMNGSSLNEAAQTLGIAITTARTFLAQITAKTDSHSQPELMRRLLAIPNVRHLPCADA